MGNVEAVECVGVLRGGSVEDVERVGVGRDAVWNELVEAECVGVGSVLGNL